MRSPLASWRKLPLPTLSRQPLFSPRTPSPTRQHAGSSLPVHPWRLLPFLGPAPARAQGHGSTSLRSAHLLCPALLLSLHGRQQQGATSSHGAHAPYFSRAPSRCSHGRAPWEHAGALLFSMAKSPGAGAPSPWSLPSLRVWGCRQELLPWPPTPYSPPWPAPSSSTLLLSFPWRPHSFHGKPAAAPPPALLHPQLPNGARSFQSSSKDDTHCSSIFVSPRQQQETMGDALPTPPPVSPTRCLPWMK
jgi:hypothetical protein